jgi:hypothetical protein
MTNSYLALEGMGPTVTQLEYTGPATLAALVMGPNNVSGLGMYGSRLADLFVYGGVGNLTDSAILSTTQQRSEIANVFTWGTAGCGIHTIFDVVQTLYRVHTSGEDALTLGINNSSHTIPPHGLCLDGYDPAHQTTAGTVVDVVAEDLNGVGIWLQSANSMTFTSGTSEANNTAAGVAAGVRVDAPSQFNTFVGLDMECNIAGGTPGSGTCGMVGGAAFDVEDNGGVSKWINTIFDHIDFGSSAHWATVEDGGSGSVTGNVSYWKRFGNQINTPLVLANTITLINSGIAPSATAGANSALPALPVGYLAVNINGASYRIPIYNP